MTGARVLARRSPVARSVRLVLALAVAVLGFFSVRLTLAETLRRSPAMAHRLAPADGRYAASLAQGLLQANASRSELARAERLARVALRQDATTVRAVTVLGLVAQLNGDLEKARGAFAYAQKLSRRDLQTHLWAIEDSVARDDIPGALTHYDMALRTSRTAPDLLFPILSAAIGDRQIQAALIKTLAAKPLWHQNFISYLAGFGSDPRAAASLLGKLPAAGVPVYEEAQSGIVKNLLSRGFLNEAWDYYASTRKGVNRSFSRDPDFTARLRYATPFDWTSPDEAGLSVAILPQAEGGVVEFATTAGLGGTVVQQSQVLPAGTYRLIGRSEGIAGSGRDRPYWTLRCSDGRDLGRIAVQDSAVQAGRFEGLLTVPSDCPGQVLALVAPATNQSAGTTGRIVKLQLLPAQK